MNMLRPSMHRQTSCKLSAYRTETTRFGTEVGASRLSPTSTLRVASTTAHDESEATIARTFEYCLPLVSNA